MLFIGILSKLLQTILFYITKEEDVNIKYAISALILDVFLKTISLYNMPLLFVVLLSEFRLDTIKNMIIYCIGVICCLFTMYEMQDLNMNINLVAICALILKFSLNKKLLQIVDSFIDISICIVIKQLISEPSLNNILLLPFLYFIEIIDYGGNETKLITSNINNIEYYNHLFNIIFGIMIGYNEILINPLFMFGITSILFVKINKILRLFNE